MSAVQVLRAKAQAAGTLKSGSQITVVQQTPQVIVIQPTNPQVVYVPQYNPTVVYGTPYVTPGYSTAAVVTTAMLAFGVGIAIGAAMNNSWGYSYWNCNWHGGRWFTEALAITETAHGTAATTVPVLPLMVPMGWQGPGVRTILRPAHMPEEHRPPPPMAPKRLAKHITPTREPTLPLIRPQTLTGATVARSSPRTATLRIPSTKQPLLVR
jgi:hypothetical protein